MIQPNFTSRMEGVQLPLISVIGDLIRSNPGTISLGQGVVYYPPPSSAIASITDFLANDVNHKYQAVEGIPRLHQLIKDKLATDNGIIVGNDHAVMVTAGGNMAFMNAILAITQAGDEIILQTPYYFNHEMAIRMANCQPVFVATDANYQLRPDGIRAAITPKTRAIVTISPNNPTGVVYPESALREINQICQENGIYHINDEAYEYFVYDQAKHFSPGSITGSSDYTISLYSLSKAYGFASWRIGYMVIPQHLLMSVKKVQDTILICPPVISQYAAVGALEAGKSYCQAYLSAIAEVRQLMLHSLAQITDLCTIVPSEGAFYLFLKIHTNIDSFTLAARLIREYQVAVIPGITFGMDTGCYLRVAYGALQQETVTTGIGRLVTGLSQILPNN